MAGPIANKIILPDDTGNTGKKVRTQTRVVGADTVHEHFFVDVRMAQILGVYRYASPGIAVAAAAQNGTSTGALWAHVPTAISNKKARIRRASIESRHVAAFAATAMARIAASRMTFTGTASGAAGVAAKMDASYPTPILDLRTAVTGLTPTLIALLGTAGLIGSLTAVGAVAPVDAIIMEGQAEDEFIVLAPGEGIVIWQDAAGTTSDSRLYDLTVVWDEIDTA